MIKFFLTFFLLAFSPYYYAKDIPLESFTRHGDYLDLQLSPDGKHMVARVRENNTVALAFLRTSDNKIVGGVKPSSKDEIHTVRWVNNERVVYELAEKRIGLDRPQPTGELFGINIDMSSNKLLYGYRASDERTGSRISSKESDRASQQILSILEDDKRSILIIEYPWSKRPNGYYDDRVKSPFISKLNVYSGKKRKLEVIPYPRSQAIADKNGNVNFISWFDDQNKLLSAYRKTVEENWQDLGDILDIDQELAPLGISDDLSTVYLSGREPENKASIIYQLNLSNRVLEPIFEGIDTDIENIIMDIDTGQPVVAITYPNTFKYHYSTKPSKTKTFHQMLAGSFSEQIVDIASSDKDGNLLLVNVRSDVNPGEYYTFDTKSKSANFVWANRSWIDPREMRGKQPISFLASDGLEINGYLTFPYLNKDNRELPPLIVMPHGGPHGIRDFWDFDAEVQLLANKGFAVLQPNFRGSGGYGENFEQLGYKQWGGTMINDIVDSTRWAIDNGLVDENNICIYGASYGGYAALMSVVRSPSLFKCAIGYVGLYDLNNMYTDSDISENYGGTAYLQKVIGTDQPQLMEYSPINHIDSIKAKIMLVHGKKDKRVSIKNMQDLEDKLIKAGNPPKSTVFNNSAHGVYDPNSRVELYKEILDFLDKNLRQKAE